MTPERQELFMIRGIIAGLTPEQQSDVNLCVSRIQTAIREAGEVGTAALALVGAISVGLCADGVTLRRSHPRGFDHGRCPIRHFRKQRRYAVMEDGKREGVMTPERGMSEKLQSCPHCGGQHWGQRHDDCPYVSLLADVTATEEQVQNARGILAAVNL